MIRILISSVALAGLGVSRLSRLECIMHDNRIDRQIVVERNALHVLEADWKSAAAPERIQRLAEACRITTPTAQLSSLNCRRARRSPIGDAQIQQASGSFWPLRVLRRAGAA